jgi:hypothetical protein
MDAVLFNFMVIMDAVLFFTVNVDDDVFVAANVAFNKFVLAIEVADIFIIYFMDRYIYYLLVLFLNTHIFYLYRIFDWYWQ